jgi:hypothetical protein
MSLLESKPGFRSFSNALCLLSYSGFWPCFTLTYNWHFWKKWRTKINIDSLYFLYLLAHVCTRSMHVLYDRLCL